jgi:hypothetical protein
LGRGFCLCHGAAGLAELLVEAGRTLDRPALLQTARTVAATGISQFHEPSNPWPSGVPVRGESPNLMLGLAGIGHFYLRLYAPELTPCVLIVRRGSFGSRLDAGAREENGGDEAQTRQQVEIGKSHQGGHHGREATAVGSAPAFRARGAA